MQRMGAAENKQLVLSWFRAGPSSPAGRAMLTEDFRWWIPKGMAGLITDGRPVLDGPDALLELHAVDKAVYAGGDTSFELRYIVAEDEWVILQAEIGARSHDGDEYSNLYVFSFKCRDGRIAEAWESTDTKYWCDTIVGRPEQLAGVQARLERARAALA